MLSSRPNSGAVVFVRSVKVSFLIFLFSLWAISVTDPERTFEPSYKDFLAILTDKFAWLGAIFAASYAGFYSRYASQWSYLANLYNQIMAVKSTLPESQKSGASLLHWQAGFIEDCYLLHLDRKEIFSVPIRYMLEDSAIADTFKSTTSTDISNAIILRHGKTEGLAT